MLCQVQVWKKKILGSDDFCLGLDFIGLRVHVGFQLYCSRQWKMQFVRNSVCLARNSPAKISHEKLIFRHIFSVRMINIYTFFSSEKMDRSFVMHNNNDKKFLKMFISLQCAFTAQQTIVTKKFSFWIKERYSFAWQKFPGLSPPAERVVLS